MSDTDPKQQHPEPQAADDAVGYGKPPKSGQFKKGVSGNRRGRPRKAKNIPQDTVLPPGSQLAIKFFLEEAYRPVIIREGNKTIKLPAIQATYRTLNVNAMRGNRFAQRQLIDTLQRLEKEDFSGEMELFRVMLSLKEHMTRGFDEARNAGEPEPNLQPHPDDIIINPRTGDVKIDGPMTREEKADLDRRLARRDEAQKDVNECATEYHRAKDEEGKLVWLYEWHEAQYMFDLINDGVPKRCKATLKNRSCQPGASREGETLAEALKMKHEREKRQSERNEKRQP